MDGGRGTEELTLRKRRRGGGGGLFPGSAAPLLPVFQRERTSEVERGGGIYCEGWLGFACLFISSRSPVECSGSGRVVVLAGVEPLTAAAAALAILRVISSGGVRAVG